MKRFIFLIILFTSVAFRAGPTVASLATYEVTGVSSGDVLNIRGGPSVATPKAGSYGPRDSGIRVYRREGNWALVGRANADQPEGWVNARYLKRTTAAARVELPLQCLGTEPFWSLTINSTWRATYSNPETPARRYSVSNFQRSGRDATMRLERGGRVAVTANICNDGMSDNLYPYDASVTLPGGRNLRGCCR